MAQRKAFLVRIDPELLRALQQWAQDEFRSLNGHIEFLLQRALSGAGRLPRKQRQSKEGDAGSTRS